MEEVKENLQTEETTEAQTEQSLFEKTLKTFEQAGMNFGDIEELTSLLALPDKDFDTISPYVLLELEKSLNNINDKLLLVQAFNATGTKAEDINQIFEVFITQIDEQMPEISVNKRDFLKRMISMLLNAVSDTEGIAKKQIKIPIQFIHKNAKMPAYANPTDAGLDIYALEDITINPGETKLIPIGIKVALPKGTELQVRPKSGLSLKSHLRIANAPGTVDEGYKDELGVIVENNASPIKEITYDFDEETHYPIITSIVTNPPIYITKGQKFAQLVLMEVSKVSWSEVKNIEMFGSEDRGGGYGSTGAY